MRSTQDTALFKILAHPLRSAILRRLMADAATLTQLGESFNKSPAHIHHHLKVLQQAGLVEFYSARIVQGGPEKYYRAIRKALFIQHAVLPETPKGKVSIAIGSMDSGIHLLAGKLARKKWAISLMPVALSSMDGLIALRQGLCQMSTCHLIDTQSEQYNRPFINHLFPGQAMALVRVFQRDEGLLVKPGNPLGIHTLADLLREDLFFVNREPGSGVRQWLDLNLKLSGIQPAAISGYSNGVHSHTEVARAVQEGRADVGIAIAASARELELHFIPLFEEPYEIAMPLNLVNNDRYVPLFEYLNSSEFRAVIHGLDGYTASQKSGEIEIIQ
ncbi:MAG: helix-turn-helix domain-containing protein [Anaerolineales bacterium]|nr:helix-turn-helix domain-containing protein [Anaerolineales bacterium]